MGGEKGDRGRLRRGGLGLGFLAVMEVIYFISTGQK